MLKALRPALQKAIEKTIKDRFHQLDTYAYEVKVEADRAQQEVITMFQMNTLLSKLTV